MSPDTSADAAAVRLRALRAMSGSERLAQALDMSETVRALWERGRRDRAMRALCGATLDRERIQRWVDELSLSEEWQRARTLAERGGS